MNPLTLRLSVTISLLFILQLAAGQSAQIDSLQRLIDRQGDTKRKVELINSLSFIYFDDDIEKANYSTEQALQLAQKINDREGEAWALAYRGLYYFFNGVLPEAKAYFIQSHRAGKNLHDINLQTYSLTQLGNLYRDKGVFDSAHQYYKLAELVNKQKPDPYYASIVKANEGRYFLIIDEPDSALTEIKETLELRKHQKSSSLVADIWILLGNCYRNKYNLQEAERYYALAFTAAQKDKTVHADYLQNMGEVYFRRGNFQLALKNWSQVLAYHRNAHYKYALAFLLFRMGEAFEEQGYYDLAAEYSSNALRISEKSQYNYLTAEVYYELAWIFYRSSNLELADRNIRMAEQLFKRMNLELGLAGCLNVKGLIQMKKKNYDSSFFYHQEGLARRQLIGNKVALSSSLFNIGELMLEQNQYHKALPFYFKGVKIDKAIGDEYGMSMYYDRVGRIYTQLGRFDSADFYLKKSIALAIPSSSFDILKSGYADMANYLQKIGKLNEAIHYYKMVNQLTDSLFNKQTAQSLASYRTLYEVERNEHQIELLNKDNQLNKALVQKQRIILYSVLLGAIVLLVLAGFYFRFSRKLSKLNKEISEQKEEIQAQAEELTESNQTIAGINEKLEERIEARTSELKQAFKELDTFFYRSSHDFRRPITTFMGLAEVARVLVKDPAALELFEKVNENALNLDKMLRKLQSVSDVDMQTLIYKEVPIKEIFEIELDELKPELDKKKIRTVLSVKLERPFYSYGALIKIIIQNLLENSIAFCTASSPLIHLSAYEVAEEVVIEVADNGLGIEQAYIERVFDMYFRANEHSKGNGLGLYIVKKTVQKLNGRVELESVAGQGTTIRIFLPHRLD